MFDRQPSKLSADRPRASRPSCTRRSLLQAGTAGAGLLALPTLAAGQIRRAQSVNDPFLVAAAKGDLPAAKRLLNVDPKLLTAMDDLGRSAFALAHLGDHQEFGDWMLEKGFVPDAHEAALAGNWDRFNQCVKKDSSAARSDHPIGGSVMFCAAKGGAGQSMWRAFAALATPNSVTRPGGIAPLQAALQYRDLAIAELTAAAILSNNGDPNSAPNGEPSPLHIAASRGTVELVEMLVRRGAEVSAQDAKKRTALDVARAAGHDAVVKLLVAHEDIARTHSTSRTAYDAQGKRYAPPSIDDLPLAERARVVGQSHGNFDGVKQAVTKEPRLAHSVATTGEICVEAGAHMGRKNVVDLLLEHGAPYSLPTAVMRDDMVRVRELLDEDPKRIHERGAHGFALLWYPIIGRCELAMTELLLARGARVEEQHFLGTTALHWACQRNQIEVAALLIDEGADVARVGRKFEAAGETPLQTAESSNNPKIAQLLRDHGAKR